MIEKEEIFEKVKMIIEDHVDLAMNYDIQGSTKLKEELGCDSLDGVEISMDLDKAFGISTDDKDIDAITNGTVNDIVDMVESKLTQKNKKS